MMFCKWFYLWGMRSHPWKFELSGGREGIQIALLGKELSVRGVQPSPLEAVWDSSWRNMDTHFLWNRPCAALKIYSHSPRSSVSCHLHFFLIKWVCIDSAHRPPWPWPLLQQKGSLSHCSIAWDPFLSGSAFLTYLSLFFYIYLWGWFFISFTPSKFDISIFWPLGSVAQQGSERELLSLDRPRLLPSLSCCDSKERSFLLTVPCGARLCFLPHMVLSGCRPSPRLCDCCPEGECSFLPPCYCLLFPKHCSCTDTVSQPQQGSSVPICWQCLVEHFC